MIPFPAAFLASGHADALSADLLTLNFEGSSYSTDALTTQSIAELPGYAFARSGEQGAVGADGSVAWYGPNVPAINDRGFHAFDAVTNHVTHSQDFSASWIHFVSGGSGTVTPNQGVAPDGTMTASRLVASVSAGGYVAIQHPANGLTNGTAYSHSIWLKSNSGSNQRVLIYGNASAETSISVTVTPQWQRFVMPATASGAVSYFSFGIHDSHRPGAADLSLDILAWQAQLIAGNFPDGGPIIRTTGASASIGPSDLRVGHSNGQHQASFRFDDESQQSLSITIEDGQLRHPVMGMLNRGVVKSTNLAAT